MVMHPRVVAEGGFTDIERRALRELGMRARAYSVMLWFGRDLTDEELLATDFKDI